MNAQEIKFRASSWGNLITNNRKGDGMGATAMKECVKIFAAYRGRREQLKNKFVRKGNAREEDSITLLSRLTKTMYRKNTVRLENDFFSGEPDLFLGPDINHAEETNDTKTSWSYITFLEAQTKCEAEDVLKGYYWQGQAYMSLTGAKQHTISYCLVNGTHKAIMDAQRAIQWELGEIDPANPSQEFIKECKQIERNHIFDLKEFEEENPGYDFYSDKKDWFLSGYDIPLKERLAQVTFERNEQDIERMVARALEARVWITKNLIK